MQVLLLKFLGWVVHRFMAVFIGTLKGTGMLNESHMQHIPQEPQSAYDPYKIAQEHQTPI